MIYFDNAATTFPKPKCVINAVNECIKNYCGNPGRSSHNLSVKSAEEIYSAREAVAGLLGGVQPESVVFTHNATYALNLALKSYINSHCTKRAVLSKTLYNLIYLAFADFVFSR